MKLGLFYSKSAVGFSEIFNVFRITVFKIVGSLFQERRLRGGLLKAYM